MTISGVLFLVLFLVVAFVLVRFAIRLASLLLAVIMVLALACWLYPPLWQTLRPYAMQALPILEEGAHDAADTARELSSTFNQKMKHDD